MALLALMGMVGLVQAAGFAVGGGVLTVSGSMDGDITVASGATLAGGGTIGSLTLGSGATLVPNAASGFKLVGTVALGGNLNLNLGSQLAAGTVIRVIDNDGNDAVSGAFAGLAEGAIYTAGSTAFRVSYRGGDGNDVMLTAQSVTVTAPAPTPTIAPLAVSVPGMTIRPAIVNMLSSDGPSFLTDLNALLSAAVGQPLQFAGQSTLGTVTLSGYQGGNLAFVPGSFQGSGDTRTNGIYALGDGRYKVVRNGQSLTITPALVRLDDLIALLPGVSATMGENGVLAATVSGVTYVVQPGVAVRLDPATGSARLAQGADGTWHFTDSLGNNQALYPAFADVTALRNALLGLDGTTTVSIQFDGTATILFKGQRYTLVPDLTLASVPAERAGQHGWQESATRFWIVNNQPLGTAQGFTVRP